MRILYFTPSIGNGGVEKMMYEWISRLNDKGVEFDIICNEVLSEKYYGIFRNLVGNIYIMGFHQLRLDKKIPILSEVLKKGHYDVFHVHSCFSFDVWMLAIAKHEGVKVRYIHSHNSQVVFRLKLTEWLDKISKPFLRVFATDYMACSQEAAVSLLGNIDKIEDKVIIMENGIDVERYKYDPQKRKLAKERYGFNDYRIIASVGRLSEQKNFSFLIDVFSKCLEINRNIKLYIVGSGELESELKLKIKKDNLINSVFLMGERNDVAEILQGIDVFVLPSLYEGFGVSLLEAQCAGARCIASSNVPALANVTGKVEYLDLNDDITMWVKAIDKALNTPIDANAYKDIISHGFDIETSTEKLYTYYKESISRENGVKLIV